MLIHTAPKRFRMLYRFIAAFALTIIMSASLRSPVVAQSVGDIIGQVSRGVNVKSMVAGWLTDKLTQALTKSSGAMPGDKRLADGGRGLGLTRDEQQRANDAAALFNQVQATAPDLPVPLDIIGQNAVRDRILLDTLKRVVARYDKLTMLSAAQQGEVEQALQPFILQYLMDQGQQAGLGAVVVPPKSVESYTFGGYCSDPHLPAPKSGEQFQLVSTNTLYPESLRPALQGLLRIGAENGRGHDRSIQGLIWTIRKVANGEALGNVLTLSSEQQQLLSRADPNALANLQSYYVKAQGQRLMQDAIRSGVGRLSSSFGGNQNFSPIGHSQALNEVANLTRQLEAAPVSGSVRGQNAAYTLLNRNVAALATTTSGGLSTVNVDLANASNRPTVFYPGTCVAQATRPTQRLAMQMTGTPNRSTAMNQWPMQPVNASLWQHAGSTAMPYGSASFAPLTYRPAAFNYGFAPSPLLQRVQYTQAVTLARLCFIPGVGWAVCGGAAAGAGIAAVIASIHSKPIQNVIDDRVSEEVSSCTLDQNTSDKRPILVYRIYDGGIRAAEDGRSWTTQDPRMFFDWRDKFAIYPKWNLGTKLVWGYVTQDDYSNGRVLPGPGPGSTAGPQPYSSEYGGGPYKGDGIEIIIPNSKSTVKNRNYTDFEVSIR